MSNKCDKEALALITPAMAKRYHIVPVTKDESCVTVMVESALSITVLEELQFMLGVTVDVQIVSAEELETALEQYYGIQSIKEVEAMMKDVVEHTDETLEDLANDAPIIKLLPEIHTVLPK